MENISSASGNESGMEIADPKLLADNFDNHGHLSKTEINIGLQEMNFFSCSYIINYQHHYLIFSIIFLTDYEYTIFQALVNEGKHMKVKTIESSK